jgi:hypothetical protein
MLKPPRSLTKWMGVPEDVARKAYGSSAELAAFTLDGLRPVRDLCVRIGVVTPAWVPLWRALGIWPSEPTQKALPLAGS